jgi:hypothetical protein
VPNDPTNMTKRNSSLDILEGVMLNVTEMNLAGSIPISILKDSNENNTLRWFNWTTSKEDNPKADTDYEESADTVLSVPLPTNNTKGTNSTQVDLLKMTKPDSAVKGGDIENLLGKVKGNFTHNQTYG